MLAVYNRCLQTLGPNSYPTLWSARAKQDESQVPHFLSCKSALVLLNTSNCSWSVLEDIKEKAKKDPPPLSHFFNWGCRRLQLGQWRHREGNSSRPQGCSPAERDAQKGTVSKGLPSSANPRPPLSLPIKGPGTRSKLDGDSCSH